MQYVILYIYLILGSKYFLAMDKWHNLYKNGTEVDNNATICSGRTKY